MPSIKNKPSRTRIRFEPPTLDEAIFAAQGLADDIEGQAEIAAMLMGLPEDEVRTAILKLAPRPVPAPPRIALRPRSASGRTVVVERRSPRVIMR